MITQQHLASFKHADRDISAREKVLNSAIISADISSSWEEYREIFDAFYADHVEVTDGTGSSAVFWQGAGARTPFQIPCPDSCNG